MRLGLSIAGALGAVMLAGASAQALPVAPAPAGASVDYVAMGCGRGWTRNRVGRCVPMYRPWMRPGRPMWRQRCWWRETPWGPRRVCRR
jgi:hypothetical protein